LRKHHNPEFSDDQVECEARIGSGGRAKGRSRGDCGSDPVL